VPYSVPRQRVAFRKDFKAFYQGIAGQDADSAHRYRRLSFTALIAQQFFTVLIVQQYPLFLTVLTVQKHLHAEGALQ